MEWYPCSYSGGNLDSLLDTHGVSPEAQTFRADRGLPFAGSPDVQVSNFREYLSKQKSGFYTLINNSGIWYNIINVRHRNGYEDGSNYGMYFFSRMADLSDEQAYLGWFRQINGKWGAEKHILDSSNYKKLAFNPEHGNEINLAGNLANIDTDYAWINYRDKITDAGTSKPIQKYILGNGAAGRAALECKYLLINDRPGDASLADTTFLVSWLNGVLKSVNRADFIQAKMTNGYYGMCFGNYQDNGWIRTTQSGLLPYQQGAAGSGHCQLGTNTWSFLKSYIDTMVTHKIMFNDNIAIIQAFDDGDGADNGCELVVTGMGNTFIGAGESPQTLRTALQSGTSSGESYGKTAENFYMASDGSVYIYSNCNAIDNRKGLVFDTNGALRPLVSTTRSLGTSSYRFSTVHAQAIETNSIRTFNTIYASSAPSYNAPRITFEGDYVEFQRLDLDSLHGITKQTGVARIVTSGQHFSIGILPAANNVGVVGTSNYKWNSIWATNGAIQTSDRREKKEISYIGTQTAYDTSMSDETLVKFVRGLGVVVYKRKNGESGRLHHGFIAQDVEALMQELDIKDHAGFIKSPKTETVKVEEEAEETYTDETDGQTKTRTVIQKREEQKEIPGEYIYGLRYEEFIADIVRFVQLQDEKIEVQERKIDSLEGRLSALENMLNPSQG